MVIKITQTLNLLDLSVGRRGRLMYTMVRPVQLLTYLSIYLYVFTYVDGKNLSNSY